MKEIDTGFIKQPSMANKKVLSLFIQYTNASNTFNLTQPLGFVI